ncbi:NAD-binding protein [Algicella marina]|uniref:NAD-binding protein n=1 Tax=Algicella marina TaxID=2683284 RepID=UPI003D66A072
MIGFGRFGQTALQILLARGARISVIENNPDRIREDTATVGSKLKPPHRSPRIHSFVFSRVA